MFIAALFTIVRTWKQPKCPLTDEWRTRGTYYNTMLLSHKEWSHAICSNMDVSRDDHTKSERERQIPFDIPYMHNLKYDILLLLLSRFSRVRLCATPWTAAHHASPSLGFSRQEHWNGLPFPSPMHESGKWSHSVVSVPQRTHGLQPTRLLHPWDFPDITGVGCHCLFPKYDINEAKTETESWTQKRLVVVMGKEVGGGMESEVGVSRCQLFFLIILIGG